MGGADGALRTRRRHRIRLRERRLVYVVIQATARKLERGRRSVNGFQVDVARERHRDGLRGRRCMKIDTH